ncbi:MAG: hypothetical protein ACREEP_02435, partial [Dongiaceae bacterium]
MCDSRAEKMPHRYGFAMKRDCDARHIARVRLPCSHRLAVDQHLAALVELDLELVDRLAVVA